MFEHIRGYRWTHFGADVLAGSMVAVILVPQAMAYAILAGLPPQFGLYACLAPLVLYGIFGSSNSLSVGPVALIALLVYTGVSPLAQPGSANYVALCGALALFAGLIKIAMSVFRMGFLTNFISYPVLVGFTNAAAVVIVFSQLKHWLGVSVEQGEHPIEWIVDTFAKFPQANRFTLGLGFASCALLWGAAGWRDSNRSLRRSAALMWLAKLMPLLVVVVATLWVGWSRLDLTTSVKVIGEIPQGLPGFVWPVFPLSAVKSLFPIAATVALVGFIQSMSVAQTLASPKRQRIDANRELLALGMADVGAAVTQGFPVTGSFSGSALRDAAGSKTTFASLATAAALAVSILWLTPLLYFIPQTVLASIVMVSVATVFDVRTPFRLWTYSRNDFFTLWFTFLAVILLGVELGIVAGVAATFVTWLWRTSRPHIVEVGRIPGSETFRNVRRFTVETVPGILALRLDESLYFANARYLHDFILRHLAERPELKAVLLIASGVNRIDATGIEVLKHVIDDLQRAEVRFVLSDVKWAVSDRLSRSGFKAEFFQHSVFLSANSALQSLIESSAPSVTKNQTPATNNDI